MHRFKGEAPLPLEEGLVDGGNLQITIDAFFSRHTLGVTPVQRLNA